MVSDCWYRGCRMLTALNSWYLGCRMLMVLGNGCWEMQDARGVRQLVPGDTGRS